jgi:hypothetical protein
MHKSDVLLLIAQTLIATAILILAWGNDAPIFNFGLVFAGILLGHVITELLNFKEDEE